ncbi:MAG: GSCFA domain-containing protein [Breznakibacter sp.]
MGDMFITKVATVESSSKIGYADHLLFIGSCFAENIGSRFKERLFNAMVNPLGVVYNPASVANTLDDLISNKLVTPEEVLFHNNLWHSFRLHGSFSSTNKATLIEIANKAIEEAHHHLKISKTVVVTFGTAWVYSLSANGQIVSNCHKYPAATFHRTLQKVDDIVEQWQETIKKLRNFNPAIRIIFTISPVRHWKDGAHGNNISKATLLLAVEQLMKEDETLEYFPAYEIMMDELRDYRFYADDMLHPSNLAQSYIFDSFTQVYLSGQAMEFGQESLKLATALNHRPLQGITDEYRKFLETTIIKIESFQARYPLIDANNFLKKAKAIFNDSN